MVTEGRMWPLKVLFDPMPLDNYMRRGNVIHLCRGNALLLRTRLNPSADTRSLSSNICTYLMNIASWGQTSEVSVETVFSDGALIEPGLVCA